MTEREWLNSLSDEELTDMLADGKCQFCIYHCNGYPQHTCVYGISHWLEQIHEEENMISWKYSVFVPDKEGD